MLARKRRLFSVRQPQPGSIHWRLVAAFLFALVTLVAQDVTSALASPDVARVGERLACRCGGCRNTVGNCPMVHCGYSDPMRRRILSMKEAGKSDDDVVSSIVREEGVVALSSPPGNGFGLVAWVMPGIALVIGFFVYSWYIRRNQEDPKPATANDQAAMERFRAQIEQEMEEGGEVKKDGVDTRR